MWDLSPSLSDLKAGPVQLCYTFHRLVQPFPKESGRVHVRKCECVWQDLIRRQSRVGFLLGVMPESQTPIRWAHFPHLQTQPTSASSTPSFKPQP